MHVPSSFACCIACLQNVAAFASKVDHEPSTGAVKSLQFICILGEQEQPLLCGEVQSLDHGDSNV